MTNQNRRALPDKLDKALAAARDELRRFQEEYQRKLISAEEAAGLVKSGMWIDYGAICGFPSLIDEKLAARVGELKDVKIRAEHSHTQIPKADPGQETFIHNSWFLGKVERDYHRWGVFLYPLRVKRRAPHVPGVA